MKNGFALVINGEQEGTGLWVAKKQLLFWLVLRKAAETHKY